MQFLLFSDDQFVTFNGFILFFGIIRTETKFQNQIWIAKSNQDHKKAIKMRSQKLKLDFVIEIFVTCCENHSWEYGEKLPKTHL